MSKYRIYLLLGAMTSYLIDYVYIHTCIYTYGAALAATRSPVIALFWCLIKFTTTTTTTTITQSRWM